LVIGERDFEAALDEPPEVQEQIEILIGACVIKRSAFGLYRAG
jgi:hypothetical protein